MILILLALAIIFISIQVDITKKIQRKETTSEINKPIIVEKEPQKEIGKLEKSDCNCNYCIL